MGNWLPWKWRRRSPGGRIGKALGVRAGWWDRILEEPRAWGALAVVLCTWLLLPSSGIEVPRWKAGEIAAHDVVIRRDVTLPDETATEALREEARASVLPVYDLEPRVRDGLVDGIHRLMAACRKQLESGGLDPEGLASESDLVVTPDVVRVLSASRCSEELEATLVACIEALYRTGVVDDARQLEQVGARGVTVRNLETGSERQRTLAQLSSVTDARTGLQTAFRALLLEHDTVKRRWLQPLASFLAANVLPDLVYNRAETAARREKAAAEVTERVQVLRRGQVLIRRGDRVTPAVERTLQALAARRSELSFLYVGAGIGLMMLLIVVGWWKVIPAGAGRRETWYRLSAVYILMILFVGVDRLGLFLANAAALASQNGLTGDADILLQALPHAAGPLVAALLFGTRAGVLFAGFESLASGILLGGSFVAVPYALAGGLVAAMATPMVREKTSALTRIGFMVGATELVAYWVLRLYRGLEGDAGALLLGGLFAFLSGPLSTAVAGFVVPILERVFGIPTDLRLLELSNQNLPLLRDLAAQAPGTFQHSVAVAYLAEAAADAIGANGLLIRVGAFYHDIGKLIRPGYYVENQRGENPHDRLSPSMSALVVMSHVKEGLELARKAKLPLPIRQAIATHHGTKLVRYFYSRAVKEAEERGGKNAVRESDFRYPGPRPGTKELGVLLLADAVEAASRTLKDPTRNRIRDMIEAIVSDALKDGQLDESELTFRELEVITATFAKVLSNTYHHRVDYPGFDFNRKVRNHESGSVRLAKKAFGTCG